MMCHRCADRGLLAFSDGTAQPCNECAGATLMPKAVDMDHMRALSADMRRATEAYDASIRPIPLGVVVDEPI